MRKLFYLFILFVGVVINVAFAQVATQEQCHQADDQLNQVYQQLRGTLSTDQKQQLKLAQRDWIKKRDAFVAANPGNPQGALYQATMQRVAQLRGFFGESSQAQELPEHSDSNLLNATCPEDIEKIKQQWIQSPSDLPAKLLINESKKVRVCPPVAPPEGFDFGIIDEKLERIFTIENHIAMNWSHQATLRSWDLKTGTLVGEVKMPSGVVDLWYSAKKGFIKLLIGPLHGKDTSECGILMLQGDAIQGLCEVENDGYSKLVHDEKNRQNIIKEYEYTKALFEYYLKLLETNRGNQGEISKSDSFILSSTGFVTNRKSGEIKLKLGAIGDLASPYALAVSKDGSNLAIGAKQGVFVCSLGELVINYIAKKWPMVIDQGYPRRTIQSWAVDQKGSINCSLEESEFHNNVYNIDSQGFKKIGSTNTEVNDPKDGRVIIQRKLCHIFNNEKENIFYKQPDSALEISYNSKSIKIPTPDLDHRPYISAAENSSNTCIALGIRGQGPSLGDYYGEIVQCDDATLEIIDRWKSDEFLGISFLSYLPQVSSPQNLLVISVNGLNQVVDPARKNILSKVQIRGAYGVRNDYPTDVNVNRIYQANEVGGISIISRDGSILKENERMYVFSNGGWFMSETVDNYYIQHGVGSHLINFAIGRSIYPFEQFDLRLNRPDIVLERLGAPKEAIETAKSLREKRLKRMGVTEEMLKPDFHLPELQIVGEVPASTTKDQLDLQIKATDDKYPLDRLRVYVNNVPVNGRDGELLRDQKTQSLEKTIPIKLAAGRNKIQVSVLNSAGAESLYANAEVNCTAERPKPKLFAVALGVSQYDRPEWCLKYAAKDATDLIGKLKAKAGSSYSEVKPLLLTDKEVTKESTAKIKEFLSGATIDDTVLIFTAGHGLLDDKYDYYFGTTDIDPAKPSERGMPYEAIDTILAEVPSLKKALLMDTCHAGELDQDEKKELAASDGKGAPVPSDSSLKGKVAMRAIGTRGMQVKAVEGAKGKSDWYEKLQDMFVDLRRGSGATVISSSQGAEYAFESSEQSNGLFTYSLMEALDGKATPNKDGQISISSIGDYVKKRVQDLTKGKQNPNLRGVNLEEDFVLGTAK